MSTTTTVEHTYLPGETAELAPLQAFLETLRGASGSGSVQVPCFLAAGEGAADRVELPESIVDVLTQAVETLIAGRAVTVAPRETVLTTQQAADILGVSRPTVVRLIDAGELPAQRPGTRRQLLLTHVLAYREGTRQSQYDMLEATQVGLDEIEDPAQFAADLRAVHTLATKRTRPDA